MNKRSGKLILAMTAVAVFASGCTTLDAYTREEQTSKTTKGALIGAGIGAVVGLMSGDDAVERRPKRKSTGGWGPRVGQLPTPAAIRRYVKPNLRDLVGRSVQRKGTLGFVMAVSRQIQSERRGMYFPSHWIMPIVERRVGLSVGCFILNSLST